MCIYNPAIVRFRGRLLMAYRVDFGYEKPFRVATALCRLDEDLRVIPESVTPLSDTIDGGATNHYDARFLVYRDRLFVHYNNDWNTVPNQIHLVELDPDTLQARSPARLLELDGPRALCEKNWMLFEHDGELFVIYWVQPHCVLRAELAGLPALVKGERVKSPAVIVIGEVAAEPETELCAVSLEVMQ
ncbi:MAG: hypothetical protein KDE45_13935 [Caldilineaceae bacterium]|nr:hypothetical protein [Caldilineaceae bacterium]